MHTRLLNKYSFYCVFQYVKRNLRRPQLRYREFKELSIDKSKWGELATDRSKWRSYLQPTLKFGE